MTALLRRLLGIWVGREPAEMVTGSGRGHIRCTGLPPRGGPSFVAEEAS